MSFDYSGMASSASSLIDDMGRSVTLRSVTKGAYDPATRTKTADTTTDSTVKAVFWDFNDSQINGDSIRREDKLALIDNTTAPDLNDKIIDGSDSFEIVRIKPIQPGDTVIAYELQLRR